MGYQKLAGGDLSRLEIAYLTEQFPHDPHGVINTNFLAASLASQIGGAGSSLMQLLSTIELPPFFGSGLFNYNGSKTKYNIPFWGSEWNSEYINTDNLDKREFAKLGVGITIAILAAALLPITGTVGAGAVASARVAPAVAAQGVSRAVMHNRLLDEIDEMVTAQGAPVIPNTAKMEIALLKLLQGLATNSRGTMNQGIRTLQGPK